MLFGILIGGVMFKGNAYRFNGREECIFSVLGVTEEEAAIKVAERFNVHGKLREVLKQTKSVTLTPNYSADYLEITRA